MGGTILGVPIIRIIIYWGLYGTNNRPKLELREERVLQWRFRRGCPGRLDPPGPVGSSQATEACPHGQRLKNLYWVAVKELKLSYHNGYI